MKLLSLCELRCSIFDCAHDARAFSGCYRSRCRISSKGASDADSCYGKASFWYTKREVVRQEAFCSRYPWPAVLSSYRRCVGLFYGKYSCTEIAAFRTEIATLMICMGSFEARKKCINCMRFLAINRSEHQLSQWRPNLGGDKPYTDHDGRRLEDSRTHRTADTANCEENGVELQGDSECLTSEVDVTLIAQFMTRYNFVRVLDIARRANHPFAGARILLLDKPGNVQSVYQKYKLLTESYYDKLTTLPPTIPEGPVGVLGLGAGTAARLLLHFWPDSTIYGWELDPAVIDVARKYFDLAELEWAEMGEAESSRSHHFHSKLRRRASTGWYRFWEDESDEVRANTFLGDEISRRGGLKVHIGDALNSDVEVNGNFAGLIVDMFVEGAVIPALQKPETWQELRMKLRPGGRIMINCGGSCVEAAGVHAINGKIVMEQTICALATVFPGELSKLSMKNNGDNVIALTGPLPDLQIWHQTLPECLRDGVLEWTAVPARTGLSSISVSCLED